MLAVLIFGKRYLFKGRIIRSWKIQIGAIALMLLCFKSVNGIFSDKENGKIKANVPIISTLNNYQDINWLEIRPMPVIKRGG